MDFLVQKINRSKKSKQPKKSRIFWAKISFLGIFYCPENQEVQKIKKSKKSSSTKNMFYVDFLNGQN